MLAGLLRQAGEQKVGERLPVMPIRQCHRAIASDVPGLLHIQSTAVGAIHPSNQLEPRFGFKDVVEPQPLPLVVAVRLTQPLLGQRHASPEHEVIDHI